MEHLPKAILLLISILWAQVIYLPWIRSWTICFHITKQNVQNISLVWQVNLISIKYFRLWKMINANLLHEILFLIIIQIGNVILANSSLHILRLLDKRKMKKEHTAKPGLRFRNLYFSEQTRDLWRLVLCEKQGNSF